MEVSGQKKSEVSEDWLSSKDLFLTCPLKKVISLTSNDSSSFESTARHMQAPGKTSPRSFPLGQMTNTERANPPGDQRSIEATWKTAQYYMKEMGYCTDNDVQAMNTSCSSNYGATDRSLPENPKEVIVTNLRLRKKGPHLLGGLKSSLSLAATSAAFNGAKAPHELARQREDGEHTRNVERADVQKAIRQSGKSGKGSPAEDKLKQALLETTDHEENCKRQLSRRSFSPNQQIRSSASIRNKFSLKYPPHVKSCFGKSGSPPPLMNASERTVCSSLERQFPRAVDRVEDTLQEKQHNKIVSPSQLKAEQENLETFSKKHSLRLHERRFCEGCMKHELSDAVPSQAKRCSYVPQVQGKYRTAAHDEDNEPLKPQRRPSPGIIHITPGSDAFYNDRSRRTEFLQEHGAGKGNKYTHKDESAVILQSCPCCEKVKRIAGIQAQQCEIERKGLPSMAYNESVNEDHTPPNDSAVKDYYEKRQEIVYHNAVKNEQTECSAISSNQDISSTNTCSNTSSWEAIDEKSFDRLFLSGCRRYNSVFSEILHKASSKTSRSVPGQHTCKEPSDQSQLTLIDTECETFAQVENLSCFVKVPASLKEAREDTEYRKEVSEAPFPKPGEAHTRRSKFPANLEHYEFRNVQFTKKSPKGPRPKRSPETHSEQSTVSLRFNTFNLSSCDACQIVNKTSQNLRIKLSLSVGKKNKKTRLSTSCLNGGLKQEKAECSQYSTVVEFDSMEEFMQHKKSLIKSNDQCKISSLARLPINMHSKHNTLLSSMMANTTYKSLPSERGNMSNWRKKKGKKSDIPPRITKSLHSSSDSHCSATSCPGPGRQKDKLKLGAKAVSSSMMLPDEDILLTEETRKTSCETNSYTRTVKQEVRYRPKSAVKILAKKPEYNLVSRNDRYVLLYMEWVVFIVVVTAVPILLLLLSATFFLQAYTAQEQPTESGMYVKV